MSGSIPKIKPFAKGPGLTVGRYFTEDLSDPYEGVVFRKVDAVIRDYATGKEKFRLDQFEVTAEHTDQDASVIASKYARQEQSLRQIVDRVVARIGLWGWNGGYFRGLRAMHWTHAALQANIHQRLQTPTPGELKK